jgi:large subunit ribosomal protein L24
MAKARIQSGDTIKITSGNYKGTIGQVLKIVKKSDGKRTFLRASISSVPGINKYKKSFKYNGQSYPGSVYQVPRLIDTSNLSHLTADNKVSKVQITTDESGKKVRTLKKTGKTIENVRLVKEKPNQLSETK